MPKATQPMGAGKKPLKVTRKHKLKGRKSTVSAHGMTNADLIPLLGKGKNGNKVREVLKKRGFDFASLNPVVETEAEAV